MRLSVDRTRCLKSGQCTYLHPSVFKEGDDGYPVVLVEHPEGDQLREAEDASEICPSQAISVTDAEAKD